MGGNGRLEVTAMHWVSHADAHTNQCALPLWSIHASMDYSRGTQITDPRAAPGNHFSWRKWAQNNNRLLTHRTPPLTRQSRWLSLADALRLPKKKKKKARQSFLFSPPPDQTTRKDDTAVHTNKRTLHFHRCCSTADQLGCWIPNRTYPINLPHTGVKDWYRGKGTARALHRSRRATVIHTKEAWR